MYIAPGEGQTAPRGQSFDVNRNVLSLHSFVASLKKMSLKSDCIYFFSLFNTCIQTRVGLQQYIAIRKYWDTATDNTLYCIGGTWFAVLQYGPLMGLVFKRNQFGHFKAINVHITRFLHVLHPHLQHKKINNSYLLFSSTLYLQNSFY